MANKKTALITGSYGGLGTQFVNIHASNGGNLILVGRSEAKLDEQKRKLRKSITSLCRLSQRIFPSRMRRKWFMIPARKMDGLLIILSTMQVSADREILPASALWNRICL